MSNALNGLRYQIKTFGCQMNEHDSERIAGMLDSFGCSQVNTVEDSDIVIFVTCCVREAADVRALGQAASLKNIPLRAGSPLQKRIVAIGGCVGQRDKELLLDSLKHVDVVFGTFNITELPQLLLSAIEGKQICSLYEKQDLGFFDLPIKRATSYAAWLPINTGCNNFCSYCIVPYVRGRETSRPLEDIVAEAQSYVAQGVKEITLLGQNVNSYGNYFNNKVTFADVLRAVSATGVERLRFTTSHPKDLSQEVIELFAELPNLMPFLHLPVQCGSNRLLKEMNRRYTVEHYLELIEVVRSVRPDIALSTDIIVGYPGETEEDFLGTYNLVKQVKYNQVFTFIYSKRAGTPAALIDDPTPKEVIQERFDRLVDLVAVNAHENNQVYKDATVEILCEGSSKRDNLMLTGKTPHNTTVHALCPQGLTPEMLCGKLIDVHITEPKTWYLQGEVLRVR